LVAVIVKKTAENGKKQQWTQEYAKGIKIYPFRASG
jgi:hypothetical protein